MFLDGTSNSTRIFVSNVAELTYSAVSSVMASESGAETYDANALRWTEATRFSGKTQGVSWESIVVIFVTFSSSLLLLLF